VPKKEIEETEIGPSFNTHNETVGSRQSNAEVIAEALKTVRRHRRCDVVFESHSHWAVGHIDGFSIRVFKEWGNHASISPNHELAM